MELMDWHRCRRWNQRRWRCPFEGQEDHQNDDDREQDVLIKRKRASKAKDASRFQDGLGDVGIPLLRGVRELKQREVPEPLRTPIPFPKKPAEVPGKIAAITPQRREETTARWIDNYEARLAATARATPQTSQVHVNSRARSSSKARQPQRVRSTLNASATAATTEAALTKSLPIYIKPPNPWDTGVQPKKAVTASSSSSNKGRIAAGAATALIGAGAAYLTARSGRGKGGKAGRSATFMLRPKGLALAQ